MRRAAALLAVFAAPVLAGTAPPPAVTIDGEAGYESHEAHSKCGVTVDLAVDDHWHVLLGPAAERSDFAHVAAGLPQALQSATATIGLEYRVHDDPALALSLQPGWYGDEHFSAGAFDVPVTLVLACPLHDRWAAVGGLEYSHLGDYLLPILGVSGEFNPQWKMDLVFPQATLTYLPDQQTTAALSIELLGSGYQLSDGRRVSYYQTHAGLSWERKIHDSWSARVKAGWAFDRVFDFYQNGDRSHLGNAPFVEVGLGWKW